MQEVKQDIGEGKGKENELLRAVTRKNDESSRLLSCSTTDGNIDCDTL